MPPRPTRVPIASGSSASSLPTTMRPSIASSSSPSRIAVDAALSAPSTSPRPSQRPLASAAASVTAANASQPQRVRDRVHAGSSSRSIWSSTSAITAVDGLLDARVLDHGHACLRGPLDEVVLDPADVGKRAEVLLERAQALGCGVARPEVALVLLLVLDREEHLANQCALRSGAPSPERCERLRAPVNSPPRAPARAPRAHRRERCASGRGSP